MERQPTALTCAQILVATWADGLSVVLLTAMIAKLTSLSATLMGTDKPVTAAPTVTRTSSASNNKATVAKLACAPPRQELVLIATTPYAAVMTSRTLAHVWLPKGGLLSSTTANVTVETGVSVGATRTVKRILSTANFQKEIVALGENAYPFLLDRTVPALQMRKCAVVMENSTRIHAKPIKKVRVFKIWATATVRNLLLSKGLTCIMPGA